MVKAILTKPNEWILITLLNMLLLFLRYGLLASLCEKLLLGVLPRGRRSSLGSSSLLARSRRLPSTRL